MNKSLLLLILCFCITIPAISQRRNCGSMEYLNHQLTINPSMKQKRVAMEELHKALNANQRVLAISPTQSIKIPLVVHVVYNNSTQNISEAQIKSQIDVLNRDYNKLNSDVTNTPSAFAGRVADIKVTFELASIDPNGNATSGITRTSTSRTSFSDDDRVKFTSQGGKDAWPSSRYLNIWVCNLDPYLGYAQFPGGPGASDGVVIGYTCFGTTGTAKAPFNKGRTATHEVGHWLNLYHIWGDDGTDCTGSDEVADTPNQADENYGCPAFPQVSCSNGSSGDMFMNYMDYTDDACMFMFTEGQKSRMRALFEPGGGRSGFVGSTGGESIVYCSSKGNNSQDEWIEKVSIGTISNTSGNNNGYGNYSSLSTTLTKGASYSITITPRWASTVYYEAYDVWIDFNKDGDFADAGEKVYTRARTKSTSISGFFNIPNTAVTGSTRLRVTLKYNSNSTPCEMFSYGEVEDYTVNISAAKAKEGITGKGALTISPNPAQDFINVSIEVPKEEVELKLLLNSIGGKKVSEVNLLNENGIVSYLMDVSTLYNGLYIISLKGKNTSLHKKVIIERK